jgi:hypothetical protein
MEGWDWLLDILSKRKEDAKEHERNSAPRCASASDLSSEYEYEYDESETEVRSAAHILHPHSPTNPRQTFYLNVDLNSSGWRGKTRSPRGVEAAEPPSEGLQTAENADNVQPSQEEAPEALLPKTQIDSSGSCSLQILDLHHARPLMKYRNQLFECRWANIIGTDLLILPSDAPFHGPILKQGDGYKIIAANSVKLITQKLTLAEKINDEPVLFGARQPDANPAEEGLHMPQGVSDLRKNQQNFLQQLAAIKKAKGETDKVITASQKAINASGPRKGSKTFSSGLSGAQVWRGLQTPEWHSAYSPTPGPSTQTPDGQSSHSVTPRPSIQANNGGAPEPENGREDTPGRKRQKTSDH